MRGKIDEVHRLISQAREDRQAGPSLVSLSRTGWSSTGADRLDTVGRAATLCFSTLHAGVLTRLREGEMASGWTIARPGLRHIVEDYIARRSRSGPGPSPRRWGRPSRPPRSATSWRTSRRPGTSPSRTPPRARPTGAGSVLHRSSPVAADPRPRRDGPAPPRGRRNGPADELVRQVSRLLSNLAHQASVVVVSSPEQQVLRSVSLMRAGWRGSFWSP